MLSESAIIFSHEENEYYFNWPLIEETAKKEITFPDISKCGELGMMSVEWKRYENEYHTINSCRLAIAARNAGRNGELAERSKAPHC